MGLKKIQHHHHIGKGMKKFQHSKVIKGGVHQAIKTRNQYNKNIQKGIASIPKVAKTIGDSTAKIFNSPLTTILILGVGAIVVMRFVK